MLTLSFLKNFYVLVYLFNDEKTSGVSKFTRKKVTLLYLPDDNFYPFCLFLDKYKLTNSAKNCGN